MSHNFRKKAHETCRFWREGKCQKGDYQCNFVHGFICPNDGRCWKENCNRVHFSQKNMGPRDHYARPHQQNYSRGGHRPRYRRSHSRSQSPPRHRKVFQRGRSPQHHRSKSRSPAYHTRVYSPYHRRSRSPSPYRAPSRSLSPPRYRSRSRNRSRSWHRSKSRSVSRPINRGCSQERIKSRSSSPIRSKSKNRSSAKVHNKSYSQSRSLSRSLSPKPKKRSSSSSSSSSSSTSRSRSRSISKGRSKSKTELIPPQSSSPLSVQDKSHTPESSKSVGPSSSVIETEGGSHNKNCNNPGYKMQLDLENIYADLDYERNPLSTASKIVDKDTVEKEALSKLQAHIARDFMNPETQKLMEQVLSSTRDKAVKQNPLDESKSKKEFLLDEVGDDIELDLEEVGDEVDDIFAKSIHRSMDDTNDGKGLSTSRKLGLQAGSNPSPPKSNPVIKSKKPTDSFLDIDFHTDWDLKAALETASKSLKKPPEMPPPNHLPDGSKGSTSLWTPALARHQTQVPKHRVGYQTKDSDWEVETPYVGRKDKSEVQRSAAPTRTTMTAGPSCDVSPSIPFALPLSEPQSIHRNSHKVTEISQESKEGRMIQQTDVLFPSAQSIPSSIPSVVQSIPSSIPSVISHTINQPVKPNVSSADQGALDTSMLPSCSANLIRDAMSEKELYHSPKEGATAPKKVSQEQTPQKSSESPKRSKRKRRKEKKTKRKKGSSEDEDDSSDSDDSKDDKKLSHENEKENDEVEMLFFKKESLIKRVKLLFEQKKIMSNQREDIISNHKGSKASLSSILEENSFLTQEIGKQIENINKIIKNVNLDIESKRGNFKQKTSLSKERSESPHVSAEAHKKSQYFTEKERISKKMIKSTERSDIYRVSKSPYQKNSRSPSPSYLKHGPSEVEHMPRDRDSRNSRSPKSVRHKRSRSPSSSVFREAPKPVPPPEVKQSASPPRKRAVKSMIEVGKKPAGATSQYQTPKNLDSSVQYAPHEAQRTYIRYTDQGMHWCKLCSLFCETAPDYVNHLMTDSHLTRVKNDRRSWLSKAPREEKDPKPPNAQVLTVPIQGLEFLHSLPCYYCSLCDAFLRDRGEALRHPESKMHISKYKVHRAQNPLFESTFLKAKTTAYAKYKIDEERKKMETELGLNEKTSVENKLLKQIKEKLDKESKEDRTSDSRDDPVKACSSIRVASRGPRYSTDKKPSTSHSSPSSTSRHSKEKECLPVNNDSSKKTSGVKDSKVETQKSELVDSEHNDEDNGEVNVKVSDKPAIEDKVETKQKEDGSRDRDTDRKTASTKLPLIGKMPFLKRKAGISKSKSQQNTPPEEVSKGKKDTKEDVSSEKLKIPLPSCTIDDDDHVNTAVEQTQPTVPKEVDDRKLPLPSVNIKEDFIPPYDPTVPPPPITGAKTWSTSDKKDSSGSALYDPLEAGDEDSSDGAAAATIEALDLLNIPLPGFKTPTEVSALPLQQETEDVYQPEDMEIENIPLDEGKIEEGIEEVYPPSGIVVHPDIPLPPAVGILPTPLSSDEPPPPGTEGTDSLLNREFDENINSGNPLPVFGPQEFIPKKATLCKIMKNKDANIPAPPGTEDEYNVEDVDHFSHLSGHSKDKAEKINRQRLHSESGSQCSSSKGAPPSFSGKILQNSLMRSLAVPKMQQMDKQLQSHKERELTPPPPGTESMPDEKDQSIMGTSNTDVMKDLGLTRGDSELMLSNLKINTSQGKALLSPKSSSSSKIVNKSGSSLNLLSFKGEVNSLEDKTSEIVQNIYIKDSSNEFSTVDGKSKESDSKSSDEESSGAYLPEQLDAKNTAMSSDASSLSHTDKAALSSKDGIVGSDLLPSISCVDNSELINSKTIVSSNIDDKEDSSNQCLTMNTSDENQVSNTIDKDVSCTPLPDKHDGENETISHDSEMQVDSTVCDSQDSYKDSTFKELGEEEVNLKNTTNSVCDSQDSDEASVSKECLSSELLSLEKTVEGVYESQESDKGSAPKECLLDEMSFKEKTDSVCDGQESDKDSASKECLPDEGISFKEKTDSVCDGQESDTDFASKECLPGDKINFKEKTDSVCDGQESDKDSASRECLPDEEMCLKEPIKDNIECYVVGEGSLVHGKDDKYQIPILEDPSIIDTTSSVNTPSASNTECDSQDSEKGSFSKVCLLEEQDSDVSSSLKETPEDSNECSTIMNEKDLNLGIDINEEPKSPIIKCRSPLQFVNFPKGFESMDISDFYSPSSDSTCTQNVDASETTILKTENLPLSVSAENMIDAQEDLCGTPQRKAESTKEDTCEFYVEKDQKEPQAAEGPSCSQTIEVHGKELYTNKDSQDHDFHSYEGHDFLESKDVKDEAFPLEYPSERKVARSSRTVAEIAEYKEQETSGESEEISHDSAILIDEVDSKTSEEESASNSGSVKERKRKSVRKATRKKTTKVRKTEDDECPSPRTSASRSSAGCLSPSFVESPRPMRSSRRAAAAAIKAMAKDQDDTPPDSPPSDDDSD